MCILPFFLIQMPGCMQEATVREAIKVACTSSIEETTMHAHLIESQLLYLEQLGELPDGGSLLYEKARLVRG